MEATTHYEGCWLSGSRHHCCATKRIADLEAALREFVAARQMIGWREASCDEFLGPIWHKADDLLAGKVPA